MRFIFDLLGACADFMWSVLGAVWDFGLSLVSAAASLLLWPFRAFRGLASVHWTGLFLSGCVLLGLLFLGMMAAAYISRRGKKF